MTGFLLLVAFTTLSLVAGFALIGWSLFQSCEEDR